MTISARSRSGGVIAAKVMASVAVMDTLDITTASFLSCHHVSTANPQRGEILSKKNKTLYILDPIKEKRLLL
jgi:hypothetical protein